MITEAKRESVHRKIDLLVRQLPNEQSENIKPYFYELFDTILDETQELQQRKVESSELRELIIEIREGFKRMDERLVQVDMRFNRLYQFLMWMMGLTATGFFGLYLKLFFLKS